MSDTAPVAAAPVAAPRARKVLPNRFKQAAVVRNLWAVVPEAGTTFEEVCAPSYWAHVLSYLRPSDRIEVLAEDGSYFAELIVRSTGPQTASVGVLRKVDLDPEADTDDAAIFVKWLGPHRKFGVVRKSDGVILKDGFAHKPDANKWAAAAAPSVIGVAA